MAYLAKETKEKIAARLKEVMPHGWKYSLAAMDGCEARLTISKAPLDLVNLCKMKSSLCSGYVQVNMLRPEKQYEGEILDVLKKAKEALNIDNYNNSDHQHDYHDVGHYVSIFIGRFGKPFQVAVAPK